MKMNSLYVKLLLSSCLLTVSLLSNVSTVSASLKVCNRTCANLYYTHTYSDGDCGGSCTEDFRNEGWWLVEPGKCKTVHSGWVIDEDFWWYAYSVDGVHVWGSDNYFWYVPWAVHNQCKRKPSCETGTPILSHRKLSCGFNTDYTNNLYF
jgi:uncharacterized membrane protein